MQVAQWTRRLLLVVTLAGAALTSARTSHADVVRTGYTSIVLESTNQCLDIVGASSKTGAAADQWPCNFQPNEAWTVQPYNGSYRVIEEQTGQCLVVANGSMGLGASIVQNTCSGATAELWSFVPSGAGFQLVSKNSGMCATVSGNSTVDGANIVQSTCGTSANFIWKFASGLVTPAAAVDLQADHSGQCLNVTSASQTSGAKVIQWPCAGSANEQWSLALSGSFYQVVSKNSGLCAAVSGTASGANVVQEACAASSDRLWTLHPIGHAYQLIAENTGLCLTVTGASQTSGAQVIVSACSSSLNDLWSVSTATVPSSFSSVVSLPVNPIGIANLPNGKVLMWSANTEFSFESDIGSATGQTYTGIFDPATDTSTQALETNAGDDMFCPGTANLFDGRILVNGGSSSPKTSLYDPASGTWSADAAMNIRRGYEGDTVLANGSVLTLGGSWSGGQGGKNGEVWTSGQGWHLLSGVTAAPVTGADPQGVYRGDNHLWMFAASGGRLFHAGPTAAMHWITTSGNGSIASAGNRGDDAYAINGKAVLYDVGLILKAGGAPAYQDANATALSYIININGTAANVTKVAPMAYPRAFANGVVLPNGQVVIVGGQTYPVPFSDDTSILIPEIWDSQTQVFRQLAPMQTPRNYHSTAILLPDGRVFVGGGGQCGTGCTANHLNAEILTPPYLLNADGSAATRPAITSSSSTGVRGQTIAVTTNVPVMSFVMIRLSSVTHSVNNDQRRIPLSVQSTTNAKSYVLSIPSDAGVALPGYYMLFALTPEGIPSVAANLLVQ